MRVLFISDVYLPRINGVSSSIRTFRADLAAAGVETILVAPAYPVPYPSPHPTAPTPYSAPVAAEQVTRVASGRVPGDPEDRRMHAGALRRALAALPAQGIDLVHVHTPFMAHRAGVYFARRRRVPVIATCHTLFEQYLHHYLPVPRWLARAGVRRLTRWQCAQLDAVIAPSEPMRARLTGYGVIKRIEVIPTGLPPACYLPGDGQRFRARFGIAPDRPLLLYAGRLAHEKNIGFLLHAFAALRRLRSDALLVLAGAGPALAQLQSLAVDLGIAPHVRFTGYLTGAGELADSYAAADVFVFASRTETQGLVLLEALAQGTPVVSTAQGAAAVLTSACGVRVAPEQPEPFAQALAFILDDPDAAAQLSQQGRAFARGWASATMTPRLVRLYRELCGRDV